ncbi:hypothetical protein EV182_001144 [Spiromyces aspiralis]|uniref:Uncharacterized protein n=1 Tax=Spiromyces aspiralis TaxID=68401 RepID=A0ACC1HV19_9FUNG|nr:hypothetical protein EV182_001144 [Spiromyces aspiralis]
MESSVASRNPFDLLSENPVSSAPQQQAKDSQKESSSGAQKKSSATTSKKGGNASAPRGTRQPTRSGFRNPRSGDLLPCDDVLYDAGILLTSKGYGDPAGESDAAPERRIRGRGRGGPRGERGRGGRRQFDRHSGTGLVDSEKKNVQGWLGDDKATVDDAEKAATEAKVDNQAAESGEASPTTPVEEEDNTITLEEYLKNRASKASPKPKVVRKANEGVTVDAAQLKDAKPLEKAEDELFASKLTSSKARKNKQQKEKVHVAIEQRFNEPEGARRGGRFGREGGPRFGGNRRQQTQARQANPINLASQDEFPSL